MSKNSATINPCKEISLSNNTSTISGNTYIPTTNWNTVSVTGTGLTSIPDQSRQYWIGDDPNYYHTNPQYTGTDPRAGSVTITTSDIEDDTIYSGRGVGPALAEILNDL